MLYIIQQLYNYNIACYRDVLHFINFFYSILYDRIINFFNIKHYSTNSAIIAKIYGTWQYGIEYKLILYIYSHTIINNTRFYSIPPLSNSAV